MTHEELEKSDPTPQPEVVKIVAMIPAELAAKMDRRVVEEGYLSQAEFVRHAIRAALGEAF